MRVRTRSGPRPRSGISRRAWWAGAASAWLVALRGAQAADPEPPSAAEDSFLKTVAARARDVGLRSLRSARSRNYLAIGDAEADFQRMTLRDCELIARDYLDHYRARGFDVALPPSRLKVVTLADERSYSVFLGTTLGQATSGLYNRTNDTLVVFDYRRAPQRALRAGHANLMNLAHEATHQLTFDTGLLNPKGDTPLCIIEGLGMYGEVRRLTGRTEPGQVNTMRLHDLAHRQRRFGWLPVATLLADDSLLWSDEPDKRLLAYAESWLLVYHLMQEPARLPGFRAYLGAIRDRHDATARLDDARAHWGDLDRLDQDLRRTSIRLLRNSSP